MYYYNQNNYGSVKYDNPSTDKIETVATGGCGVCSACMVINNLAGKELYTVAQMARFSLSHGARDNSGTNEAKLLDELCKANKGFSWKRSSSVDELVNHLKAGGMAICNQGDAYNVFSTAGHFVVADKMDGSNIDVLDPQMSSTKYDKYNRPQRIVKKTKYGCVVSKAEMAKACQDRTIRYYLVTYKGIKINNGGSNKVSKYGNAAMKSAQKTYADSDLTEKVGAVGKGERVCYLGTGEGRPMIAYQTSKGYKVGFVRKDSVKRD